VLLEGSTLVFIIPLCPLKIAPAALEESSRGAPIYGSWKPKNPGHPGSFMMILRDFI